MASNADLIEEIEKLDSKAATEGLTNKQLAALLKQLKAVTVVADGKSIVTRRGVLGPGAEVKVGDISEEAFERFVNSGHITA